MINEYRAFTIPLKEGSMQVEVNWNDDPKIANCEELQLKIKDQTYHVKKEDLVTLLLVIGSEQDQKKLLPIKLTKVKRYDTVLDFTFSASRNFQKGESITVRAPHTVSIPIEDEVFAGAFDKQTKGRVSKSGLIIPNKK